MDKPATDLSIPENLHASAKRSRHRHQRRLFPPSIGNGAIAKLLHIACYRPFQPSGRVRVRVRVRVAAEVTAKGTANIPVK